MIKNITVVNAHWNNRGDEAALLAVLKGLKKSYPQSRITIIFKDGKSVEQFPDIENVDYFAAKFKTPVWDIWLTSLSRGFLGFNSLLKKTVKTIRKSDLVIYSPGGSVINKRFWWIKQMEYLTPFLCARLYGIPMLVAAPSMGPFDSSKSNKITKWLLRTPKVLCVREEISRNYLKEIDISRNVAVTIDSAFYDEVDLVNNQNKLEKYSELNNFLNSYEKVIGITITDFKWHVKYTKDKELSKKISDSFHQFIKYLKDRGHGVLFIPQLFGNQNDIDYMNGFSAENTYTMSDKMDTYFQQYVISKLYAVAGMRYHSNIFSAKMGTPFIAVIYEEKMQGFLDLAEMNDYSIPLNEVSSKELTGKFQLLETRYSDIKILLSKGLKVWRAKAQKTMELLTLKH